MISYRAYEKNEPGRGEGYVGLSPVIDEEEEKKGEPARIRCATCGHELTTSEAGISVEGSHRHVKVNPAGLVFHIACFDPTPGVLPVGSPSEEWSWFAGFQWQVALCGHCAIHLGWTFVGEGQFTALIEGRFESDGR